MQLFVDCQLVVNLANCSCGHHQRVSSSTSNHADTHVSKILSSGIKHKGSKQPACKARFEYERTHTDRNRDS